MGKGRDSPLCNGGSGLGGTKPGIVLLGVGPQLMAGKICLMTATGTVCHYVMQPHDVSIYNCIT